MKRFLLLLSMLLSLLIVVGCGGGATDTKQQAKVDLLTTPGAAQEAMAQLQELPEFKGKEVRIFQNFNIFREYIDVMLVIPDSDKVDAYTYKNGKWQKPEPVQLSGDGTLEENSTPISAYDFSKVPEMVKIAEEKAKELKVENPQPFASVLYISDPTYDKQEADLVIEGDRATYEVIFNLKGEFVKIHKR